MTSPDDAGDPAGTGRRIRAALTLTVILLLAVLFRLGSVGHLLTWDEAMQVCAARSFAAGDGDGFSQWMWRHPPVYSLLLSLLRPLGPGFAERAEVLGIAIGLLNIILLYRLNRRIAGERWGIWSAFFLAVLPGAIFFDVWIKADTLVAALGLTALLMAVRGKPLWAGLALGVGILTGERAVFYVIAAGLLGLLSWRGAERIRGVAVMTAAAAVTAAWWFVLALPAGGSAASHVAFAEVGGALGWDQPWHHYLGLLPGLLGVPGLVLAAGGILVLVVLWTASRRGGGGEDAQPPSAIVVWPLWLWIPALAGLSLLANKAGWVLMSLLPGLAALQGACVCWLAGGASRPRWPAETSGGPGGRAWVRALKAAVVAASLLAAAASNYETDLHVVEAGHESGAAASRLIAETLNESARDGERLLAMPFYYWKGTGDRAPCPVFTHYFRRRVDVLMVSAGASTEAILDAIREHRIHWAMLSPLPGPGAEAMFEQFLAAGLRPIRLPGAHLYDCRTLWQDVSMGAVDAMTEDQDARRGLLREEGSREGTP